MRYFLFLLSTRRPTRPAGDAAGAAHNLAFFTSPSRAVARLGLARLPAAHLRASVGPLSTPHAVAERFRQRDIIRHIPGGVTKICRWPRLPPGFHGILPRPDAAKPSFDRQ